MSTTIPSRSPWIEQLRTNDVARPLTHDVTTDVAIVGAGIAGVASAFFILRNTDMRVLLIERDRVGHGATGHNAGQLATYFERPLLDLVHEYGFEQAIAAQAAIDNTWDLLDIVIAESGATAPIDRFIGHMGMFTLNHLEVHLTHSLLRQRGELVVSACAVSEDAPFLHDIPTEFAALYSVVPQARIRELLRTDDDRYVAVMSDRKGCGNSALLVEQVLDYLVARYPERFQFANSTAVTHITLDRSAATISAGEHRIVASRVVMCTNGFMDHVVENLAGAEIGASLNHRLNGTVGYMAGFVQDKVLEANAFSYIRNTEIGGDTPYVYVTSRPFDRASGRATLTCIGGPENVLEDRADYSPGAGFPAHVIDEIDTEILPIVHPSRAAGLEYEYAWHGLMGYTESRVRLIGFEPRNPLLMYNLGCNGVGFMPSIYGGFRISQLLCGEPLGPSIFDPT